MYEDIDVNFAGSRESELLKVRALSPVLHTLYPPRAPASISWVVDSPSCSGSVPYALCHDGRLLMPQALSAPPAVTFADAAAHVTLLHAPKTQGTADMTDGIQNFLPSPITGFSFFNTLVPF